MARYIPAPSANPPPFIFSMLNACVFQWTDRKVKTLSISLTPVNRISGISNSSLDQVVRLFLSAVARNNPSRQHKATCSGTLT